MNDQSAWLVLLVLVLVSAFPQALPAGNPNDSEWFNTDNLMLPLENVTRKLERDDIKAVTNPVTAPVTADVFCGSTDRVVGVTINGQSRAYSEGLLAIHEVVNDTLGGVPIAVTYCPLVDSFTVFDRRIDGRPLEFGVSGMLYNSNLIMYDRSDLALWPQLHMQAFSGPNAGKSMRHLAHEVIGFDQWAEEHPDSDIMLADFGPVACMRNAYESYFADEDEIAFPVSPWDDRLPAKSHIVGLLTDDFARAYPLDELAKVPGGLLKESMAGGDLVLQLGDDWGEVSVLSLPEDARVAAPSFWFSWAAMHEESEIYAVPEPSTMVSLLVGLVLLFPVCRRYRVS